LETYTNNPSASGIGSSKIFDWTCLFLFELFRAVGF
jgi:hypothetical protein